MPFVPESLFQSSNDDDDRRHSFISSSSCIPQSFQGMEFLMMRRSPASLISGINQQADYHQSHHEHDDDDASDDGSQFMIGEKKRRLNVEQVKALEKSFELGNKLEPERKLQLARALGLQPRQISIWFQNRRARSKTRQLERDYGVLKRQIESIKADNDALKTQNKKLLAQLMDLKERESTMISTFNLNNKENQQGYWRNNGIDNSKLNANGHLMIFSSSQSQDGNGLTRQEERVHQMSHQKADPHATDGLCNNVYAGVEEISSEYWTW